MAKKGSEGLDPFPLYAPEDKRWRDAERLGEARVQIYSSTIPDICFVWHCVPQFANHGFSIKCDRHLPPSCDVAGSPFGHPVFWRESAHWNVITGRVVSPLSDSVVSDLEGFGFCFALRNCLLVRHNVSGICE